MSQLTQQVIERKYGRSQNQMELLWHYVVNSNLTGLFIVIFSSRYNPHRGLNLKDTSILMAYV